MSCLEMQSYFSFSPSSRSYSSFPLISNYVKAYSSSSLETEDIFSSHHPIELMSNLPYSRSSIVVFNPNHSVRHKYSSLQNLHISYNFIRNILESNDHELIYLHQHSQETALKFDYSLTQKIQPPDNVPLTNLKIQQCC